MRPDKVWIGRGGRVKKSYSEKVVKKNILNALSKLGIFAWNNPRGGAWTKKGPEDPKEYFLKYGGPNGAADIIGILPGGRFLAIETKRTHGGKESEAQKAFLDQVNRTGGLGFFAKNLDEVVDVIKRELPGRILA